MGAHPRDGAILPHHNALLTLDLTLPPVNPWGRKMKISELVFLLGAQLLNSWSRGDTAASAKKCTLQRDSPAPHAPTDSDR